MYGLSATWYIGGEMMIVDLLLVMVGGGVVSSGTAGGEVDVAVMWENKTHYNLVSEERWCFGWEIYMETQLQYSIYGPSMIWTT